MQIFGEHDANTLAQLRDVASRAAKAALMADGHLGYVMPIGGVAAYRNQVSVVGVGFDIACGNAAIRTDLTLADLGAGEAERGRRLNALADEIQEEVSFGIGRKNLADDAPVDHPLFDDPAWDALPANIRGDLRKKARAQLGTVGSGNHYVDIFADENDTIWVGVHFGSRGFGHTIASGFLALGQGARWGERVPEREVLLSLDKPLGHDYWRLMELAGRYAYAGREWVARKVAGILGGHELELVHNHHNFAWKEKHEGEEFVVVRKGATPAFPGQKGFIGGSMGDDAVIVQGTPEEHADAETRKLQRAPPGSSSRAGASSSSPTGPCRARRSAPSSRPSSP
jgi:tRNA-splicing ligase RtcB